MRELPILFSAPMVRATLEGRKTQTRRVVKLPADAREVGYYAPPGGRSRDGWADPGINYWTDRGNHIDACPYGQPGDRLWVRETWGYRVGCGVNPTTEAVIEYRADSSKVTLPVPAGQSGLPRQRPNMTDEELLAWWDSWRPSIHMPRWASRITLEVTGVRVERLQDISQRDALAEGAPPSHPSIDAISREHGFADFPRSWFGQLWESINGAGSWDANPWVWVVEFQRVEVPHG